MSRSPIFLAVCATTFFVAMAADAQSDLISYQPYGQFSAGGPIRTLAFNPQGNIIAAGGDVQSVVLYDLPGRRQNSINLPRGEVRSLAFSRDGKTLAIGTDAGVVYLWSAESGQLRSLSAHRGQVGSLAFNPAGDLLASAGDDRQIVLWNVSSGQEAGRLRDGHGKPICLLTFQGRGDQLVSVGRDRHIVMWDVKNKSVLRQTIEPDAEIKSANVGPGADWLVLGTETAQPGGFRGGGGANRMGLAYEDRVKFYDLQTGLVVKTVNNLIVEPTSVSLSADYKYVAVAQRDIKYSAVALYDVDRGFRIAEIPTPGKATEVAFSPNGLWLAYGDEKGTVSLLDVKGVYPRGASIADLGGKKYSLTSSAEPLVRPSRRIRFAVMDLGHEGVEEYVAKLIGDQLTNRLAQNPGVRLVERRRIDQVLKEQNFQSSGQTDPATAARLARILNVQKVIVGSVGRLGTTMTIYTQLVDVETAAIDGTREMQCRNCALEDLPMAVAEMSAALVASASASLQQLPAPPSITIESPADGAELHGQFATLQGRIDYSTSLEGVELVVNGKPLPASRLLENAGAGKLTRLADGTNSFSFVQTVPLESRDNMIAVRALSADGNDEQHYVSVRRVDDPVSKPKEVSGTVVPPAAEKTGAAQSGAVARKRPGPPAPGLSLGELEQALRSRVPQDQIAKLAVEFGLASRFGPNEEKRLRDSGATNALILKLSAAPLH